MLASLIAIASVAPKRLQVDYNKPISYEANVLPVRKVLADISRLGGIRLEGFNETINDRIILHLENAPLSDVLKQIAHITYAVWEPADGGLRLRRDPVQVAANEKQTRQKNLVEVNKVFNTFRKRLAKEQTFDPDKAKEMARSLARLTRGQPNMNGNFWVRQNQLQQALPLGRAMDRIMLSLTPETVVDLPVRSRIALSTDPTTMEYPMPQGAVDALQSLVEEQAVWADAASRYMAANNQPEGYEINYGGMEKKSFRNASRALLYLTRNSHSFGLSAELLLADAKGHVLGRTSTYLYPGNDGEDTPPPPVKNPPKPLPVIPVSSGAQEAAVLLGNDWAERGKKKPASNELRYAILHPTKIDPLSLFYGEGLLTMAKSHHENLAVLADDTILGLASIYYKDKGFNQDTARKSDLSYIPQDVHIEGGWYTARPTDMDDYSEGQGDRESLEALLNDLDQQGRIPVDSLATYAAASPGDSQQGIVVMMADALSAGAGQIVQQNEWDTLRFYGSLSPEQRASASKQGFAQLNADQLALANKLVFGMYSRLNVQVQTVSSEAANFGDMWNVLSREPVEALPNGLPARSYFTISSDTGSVILAEMQYGEWYQGLQVQEPENLAYMLYQTQHPNGQENWRVLNMQAADRRQINILFTLAPGIDQTMNLTECKSQGKRSLDYKGLPDALRDRLAKAIAEIEKNVKSGAMSFGGGDVYNSNGGAQP